MKKRAESRRSALRLTCGALMLALLVVVGVQAEETVYRVNECNSSLVIGQPTMTAVNMPETVTLTITNVLAQDGANNPIDMIFDKATYSGDCVTPAADPCVPNMPAAAMYQANLGGTCNGMGGTVVTANPLGDGVVDFEFAPDLALANSASCTIVFDVSWGTAGTYQTQALAPGLCQGGAFNSANTQGAIITVNPAAPTLGEFALAALALALLAGAWLTLRRKSVRSAI